MAWTAPVTWAANAILTAAQLNTNLRDNLNQTMPALVTAATQWCVSTGANALVQRDIKNARVETSQTTASTTYVDLTTVGPAVTVTTGTTAMVILSARTANNTANTNSKMSCAVSGATTIAAGDNFTLNFSDPTINNTVHFSTCYMHDAVNSNALTAGSNTFTAKYKVGAASTGTWEFREIIVIPFN